MKKVMSLSTIFSTEATTEITMNVLLMSIAGALVIGLFIAFMYTVKSKYSKSFVTTLAILPAVVAMVIMMVNGSIGTGIAVAGAFSLVRFRAAPGTAKEIAPLFMAMSTGLTCGMGYIGYTLIYTIIIVTLIMLYEMIGIRYDNPIKRKLVIMIPESLEYTEACIN